MVIPPVEFLESNVLRASSLTPFKLFQLNCHATAIWQLFAPSLSPEYPYYIERSPGYGGPEIVPSNTCSLWQVIFQCSGTFLRTQKVDFLSRCITAREKYGLFLLLLYERSYHISILSVLTKLQFLSTFFLSLLWVPKEADFYVAL